MKHIKKSQPPQDFINWKNKRNENWQPNWHNFQKPEKTLVHKSLIQEQGFICCYCGKRINQADSHIEHLKPRNQYPDLTLDYTNLIASCQGESEKPPTIPVHCGHKKAKWYEEDLMVSPLDINCADFFRYTDDGQILATTDPYKQAAAKETIKRLALGINKLKKMRAKAIEGFFDDFESLNDHEIRKLIDAFAKPNANGKHEEFCHVIVYVLKQYL